MFGVSDYFNKGRKGIYLHYCKGAYSRVVVHGLLHHIGIEMLNLLEREPEGGCSNGSTVVGISKSLSLAPTLAATFRASLARIVSNVMAHPML